MKKPKKPTIFNGQPSNIYNEKNAAKEQIPVEKASTTLVVCIPMNLPSFSRNDFAELILYTFTH